MKSKRRTGRFPPLAAGLSVGLFTALLAGCGSEPPQPPYLNKFLVTASPARTSEATFYNYGKGGSGFLGATVATPMFVNVRRCADPFDPEQGQVFAMHHGYRLRLVWKDERHLRIDYTSSGDVSVKRPQSGEVTITFHSVPQNQLPEPYQALPETETGSAGRRSSP